MNWDELTSDQFERARMETGGVCLFHIGAIERHGSHLPLSTDMVIGRKIAEEASKLEPIIIFPYYPFGQISEARHTPGAINLRPDLALSLLDEVFREISRNGFKKIIIFSSHGGNSGLLNYLMESSLHEKKDYVLYSFGMRNWFSKDETQEIIDTTGLRWPGDHAGAAETSYVMAVRPDLVHMEHADITCKALGRLNHLEKVSTPISWYADFPTHQDSDPSAASIMAGEKMIAYAAANLVKAIKIVKADSTAGQLQNDFFARCYQINDRGQV